MFLVLLLLVTQSPTSSSALITVQEELTPSQVSWNDGRTEVRKVSSPDRWGKLGWSFDVNEACDIAIIEGEAGRSELVEYPGGRADGGIVLLRSSEGLTSPSWAPDGRSILVIQSPERLLNIDVADAGVLELGVARFATWGPDGSITAYSRTDGGCNSLRRFRPRGAAAETTTLCKGFAVVPSGGRAPVDAPLPVIDSRRRVVDLFGFVHAEIGETIELSTLEQGFACSNGIDFVSADGRAVTLSRVGRTWRLSYGLTCAPLARRSGHVKVSTCLAPK